MEHDYITTQYYLRIQEKAKYEHISGFTQEEIVDELYIVLFEAIPKFEGRNGATEKTFAEGVMRKKIIDLRRYAGTKKRKTEVKFADIGLSEYGERTYPEEN